MEIIVGKMTGFCFGVKRAVDGSLKEIKDNKKVYCLGELVHNKDVIKDLESHGITIIKDIEEVKDKDAKLIIRAHGVDKSIYNKAKEKGLSIIDFTCPLVSKIHNIAEKYKEKDYYIFLIGNKNHPEIIGTKSHCGNNYSIIEDEKDVDSAIQDLLKTNYQNLLIIVQTTYNKDSFKTITNIIKEKINLSITIKDTICNATEQRQTETEDISKKVDLMIIVGGKNSSNTKKLYEIAKKNTKALLIENPNELNLNNIRKQNRIGIVSGASTPIDAVNDIIKVIQKD